MCTQKASLACVKVLVYNMSLHIMIIKKKVLVDLSSFGFIEKENNMFILLWICSTCIYTNIYSNVKLQT